jgi:hypothetical protein
MATSSRSPTCPPDRAFSRSVAQSCRWATLSEDEQKAVYADYQAINQTPGVTPGLGLDAPETATTVRVQDGKTVVTDGPFVEIKDSIGGYAHVPGRYPIGYTTRP